MSKSIYSYIRDYKQYRTMSAVVGGMSAANVINGNIVGFVFSALWTFYLKIMSDSQIKNLDHCYEYVLLNDMCQIIIDELAQNICKLELGNIEGIFAYVNYILKNNYLSYDRNLPPLNSMKLYNEQAILSALALNNHGVCRNEAPLLTDIYHKFNMDAHNIICSDYSESPIVVVGPDILTEEDYKQFTSDGEMNEKKILEMLELVGKRVEEKLDKEKEALDHSIYGNHAITQVNSEEYSYLLDPTRRCFYKDSDEDGRFYADNGDYIKIVSAKKRKNLYPQKMHMDFVDKKPIIPAEEMNARLEKSKKVITENVDIIDEMHRDIEPILERANEVYKLILKAR